ncbi:MAG: hypothetical protein WAK33_10795 [Silvibacterium sp.]
MLFKPDSEPPVMSRLVRVTEMAVTVPGRLVTEIEELSDTPTELLTPIPLNEVHVVTLPEVVQEARACVGSSSAPMARTNGLSLNSAERGDIAERAWDDMGNLSRKAIGDFQRTPLAIDSASLNARRSRDRKVGLSPSRQKEHHQRWHRSFLEHAKSIDEPQSS